MSVLQDLYGELRGLLAVSYAVVDLGDKSGIIVEVDPRFRVRVTFTNTAGDGFRILFKKIRYALRTTEYANVIGGRPVVTSGGIPQPGAAAADPGLPRRPSPDAERQAQAAVYNLEGNLGDTVLGPGMSASKEFELDALKADETDLESVIMERVMTVFVWATVEIEGFTLTCEKAIPVDADLKPPLFKSPPPSDSRVGKPPHEDFHEKITH